MRRKRKKPQSEAELKNYHLTNFVNEKTFSPIETSDVKKIADAAIKILAGTARSMGIQVTGA